MSLIDKLKRKKDETTNASEADVQAEKKTKKKKTDHGHDHDHDHGVEEKKTARAANIHGAANQVILQPLVTEKSAIHQSVNQYSFVVDRDATKLTIKQAIKDLYGVAPVSVRVVNVQGKYVRFGRTTGRRQDWKKAIVTLPQGKSIQIHEGV